MVTIAFNKTILTKILSLLIAVFIIFVAAVFYLNISEQNKNKYLHEKQKQTRTENFSTIVELRGQSLRTYVSDYSYWNDMIKFANNFNERWAKINVDVSITTYDVSYAWVFNEQGKLVYHRNQEELPRLDDLPGLSDVTNIKELFKEGWQTHYFYRLSDGSILEVAGSWMQPEEDLERTSSAKGYYFSAIVWDSDYIADLGKIVRGDVEIVDIDYHCDEKDAKYIDYFFKKLLDHHKKPIAMICVKSPNSTMEQMDQYARNTLIIIVSIMLTVLALLIIVIMLFVVIPVRKIGETLKTGEMSHIETIVRQTDEFGTFAKLLVEFQKSIKEKDELKHQLYQAGKMASLGVLGAGIAHELNNPLTGILGYSDFLLSSIDDGSLDSTMLKGQMQVIKTQAERMRAIVNHMREYSRTEYGEKKETTNLNVLIDKALILLKSQLKISNIDLKIELEPNIPMINCDVVKIESVIQNLIVNARDALDEVTDTRAKEINLKTKVVNSNIVLSISDNANGIPDHVRDKIFDPFFTTKPVGKGTGLGLSMVVSITKEHGGKVNVISEVGKGTTFEVTFPINVD